MDCQLESAGLRGPFVKANAAEECSKCFSSPLGIVFQKSALNSTRGGSGTHREALGYPNKEDAATTAHADVGAGRFNGYESAAFSLARMQIRSPRDGDFIVDSILHPELQLPEILARSKEPENDLPIDVMIGSQLGLSDFDSNSKDLQGHKWMPEWWQKSDDRDAKLSLLPSPAIAHAAVADLCRNPPLARPNSPTNISEDKHELRIVLGSDGKTSEIWQDQFIISGSNSTERLQSSLCASLDRGEIDEAMSAIRQENANPIPHLIHHCKRKRWDGSGVQFSSTSENLGPRELGNDSDNQRPAQRRRAPEDAAAIPVPAGAPPFEISNFDHVPVGSTAFDFFPEPGDILITSACRPPGADNPGGHCTLFVDHGFFRRNDVAEDNILRNLPRIVSDGDIIIRMGTFLPGWRWQLRDNVECFVFRHHPACDVYNYNERCRPLRPLVPPPPVQPPGWTLAARLPFSNVRLAPPSLVYNARIMVVGLEQPEDQFRPQNGDLVLTYGGDALRLAWDTPHFQYLDHGAQRDVIIRAGFQSTPDGLTIATAEMFRFCRDIQPAMTRQYWRFQGRDMQTYGLPRNHLGNGQDIPHW